jgi:hypothetical protein
MPGAAACSIFAPSYDEFASGSGAKAGAGGLTSAAVSGSGGATGGEGDQVVGGTAGSGAGIGNSDAGMAGTIAEPDPEPVRSQTVAASDVHLQSLVLSGLPNFSALTRYDVDEAAAAAASAPPLYQPYDPSAAAFWDNVVAEQLQARLAIVLLPSRGVFSLTSTDLTGPGNENPRRLAGWVQAATRADVGDSVNAYCLVDSAYLLAIANNLHGANSTQFDCSVTADWTSVVWARAIQPWFDTVPSAFWYTMNGHPLIELAALPPEGFKNPAGNLSNMLSSVAKSFNSAYGKTPSFILDASWFAADSTLTNNDLVKFERPWLTPSGTVSNAFSNYNGNTFGTVVPGFSKPLIARHSVDAYKNQVTTLLTGLGNAAQSDADLVALQGFTDFEDSAGFYRSNAADWTTPNEYLNLVARFSDPKTLTLRLEAEGCDSYSDTSAGNSGKAFRRSGDLDVRALNGSGWAVTDTAPGEWIEFDDVNFSAGNYRFVAEYATGTGLTAGDGPRIELVLDDVKLPPVILDKTVSADSFTTTLLGQAALAHGQHNLRLRFLDGLVDLDWLFIEKLDHALSLQINAGTFVSAQDGGGSVVHTDAMNAQIWEAFTFDDLNGGTLDDGDVVDLQSYNGLYLTVGAGQTVSADQRVPSPATTFTMVVQGGGTPGDGAMIALQTSDKAHYLTAGANDTLDASGTTVGVAQTFKLGY